MYICVYLILTPRKTIDIIYNIKSIYSLKNKAIFLIFLPTNAVKEINKSMYELGSISFLSCFIDKKRDFGGLIVNKKPYNQ